MFEFVREKKYLTKIVLALIILPFAFWGIGSYWRSVDSADVAKVAGQAISQREFEQALRDQRDRMRNLLGRNFDPAMLDNPELRSAVLENLILQRVLLIEAVRAGLTVPDSQLAAIIQDIEAFQQDGKFSKERYETLLRNQGLTPVGFETKVRQELMVQQLRDGVTQHGFVSRTVVDRVIALAEQQREVSLAEISPEQFMSRVKVDDAAVKAYYEDHRSEFQVPEQVRVEYLPLSPDVLMQQVAVSPDEIKKYYEEHSSEFGQPEERRASHILISAPANASEAEKAAARAKAEEVLKQARQSPASFADLAKRYSQDAGSAANGGDLGFFARGAMVKPFEDAAFQMKIDEIRGPIESQFGYHVIKLTAIKPGKAMPFEDARSRIEQELKKQKAAKKFAEVAENFSNMVYEQADSLKPAAEAFKLTIQQSPWLSRKGGDVAFPGGEKMLEAVFTDEVLKNKRNTEAVEVAPNTLVAARVLEYKPASPRPFDEVSSEIRKKLVRNQAAEMALKEGKEKLARLQQGVDAAGITWGKPQPVSRRQPRDLNEVALRQVFKADASKLPAYVGAENPKGGFTLLRISRMIEAEKIDDVTRRAYTQQLQQLRAQEEYAAYLSSIKKKADVKIREAVLEKKQ